MRKHLKLSILLLLESSLNPEGEDNARHHNGGILWISGAGKRVADRVFIQLNFDKAVEGMRTYFTQAPAFIFHLFLCFHPLSHVQL